MNKQEPIIDLDESKSEDVHRNFKFNFLQMFSINLSKMLSTFAVATKNGRQPHDFFVNKQPHKICQLLI